MAQRSTYTVEVDGIRELNRQIRALKDRELGKKVRLVNKAAAMLVKPEAVKAAPDGKRDAKSSKKYRPGKLDKSVGITASAKGAVIKAGSAGRVPYAAAIHFGYGKRNINPNRFLYRAMARSNSDVRALYERDIAALIRDALESE